MCSFGETLFIKDTKYFIAWGFPDGALEKNLPANAGGARVKAGSPGLGRSPGE